MYKVIIILMQRFSRAPSIFSVMCDWNQDKKKMLNKLYAISLVDIRLSVLQSTKPVHNMLNKRIGYNTTCIVVGPQIKLA